MKHIEVKTNKTNTMNLLLFSSIICISLFVIAMSVPALYYGFQDENSTCQHGTRGGITLSDWAKGAGLSGIIITGLVYIAAIVTLVTGKDFIMRVTQTILFFDMLFWVIWAIWGIVVLATNENNTCVSEGKGMAVASLIILILGGFRFGYVKLVIVATNSMVLI